MNTTIKTISKQMGVSISTVSKALNGYPDISQETRTRVVETAAALGYIPNMMARNLVKQVSNVVGVIIPDIETSIYGEIFKSLQIASRANDINLFLCDCSRNPATEREYVRTVMESQASGLIIAPCTDDIRHIKELVSGRIPVVYIGGKVEDPMENYVSSDNATGGRIGTEYLIGLGHTDILFMSDTQTSISCRKRISGYEKVMREYGLIPRVIINQNEKKSGVECGYALTKTVISRKHLPTAIFAVKDTVAIGVIQALSEAGLKVPEDISVMGYDDIAIASFPMMELTTIAQPKKEMGEHAMEILLRCVAHGDPSLFEHYFARPALIVRSSCSQVC